MAIRTFPTSLDTLSWSSKKSMSWNTEIQTSGSGKVRTLTNLLLPNWTIETKFAYLTNEEYRTLFGFVALCKGAHEPFLWLDPEDNQEEKIRLAMSSAGKYQAVLKMGDYVEPVEYIDNEKVYVNGVLQDKKDYSVVKGMIVFNAPPAVTAIVTASYRYYWKVMFKDDGMTIETVFANINKSGSFKLTTVR